MTLSVPVPALTAEARENRVLALMSSARDGQRTVAFLAEIGIDCLTFRDLTSLCDTFASEGGGVILLADEAIIRDREGRFGALLRKQPAWSAVPVVVLARESGPERLEAVLPTTASRFTLVELPLRTRTLISVVRAALAARRHQYQLRDAIEERERRAAELLALTAESERQRRLLREADQRKDEFLATLAHELRNPLAPMRTGLEVLKRRPDDATAAKTREMMDRQLRHMVRLIDDLLDVSRITRGKFELQRESVTLAGIIDAALEASRPQVEAGRHQLEASVSAEPVRLFADGTRLAQVVSNLVNNAAKYSPPCGRITVRAYRDGKEAVVEVHDKGVGIPRDKLSEVFEMFSQVSRTVDRSQGGLGIGLALVRSLVQMHGGTVTADSPGPDQGSVFVVRIPIEQPQPAATDGKAAPRAALATGGRRVLIVDDNVDAAETLAMFLEMSGNRARISHDGPDAIAVAAEFQPEVVFLDIGLPGISGYEVAQQLRRQMGVPALLVAVTGWGTAEDKKRAAAAGFDFHLTKPVDLAAIEGLMARAGTAEGRLTPPPSP